MSLCYLSFHAVPAEYCAAGAVSHCAQTRYIGMGPAGGFADLAVVPARHAFAMPADLPATYSALVEPFAVGLHGVHSAEVTLGDEVVIVGAGGVGLTTLVWALAKGAVRVTVADPDHRRREFAHAIGATDVLESVCRRRCRGLRRSHRMCRPPRARAGVSGRAAPTRPSRDFRRMRRANTRRTRLRRFSKSSQSVTRSATGPTSFAK